MSTKDAVGNGNAAMKEAAMMSLSTEAADGAECSASRTARAGARRDPCMLMATVPARRAWSLMLIKSGQILGCRGRRRLLCG